MQGKEGCKQNPRFLAVIPLDKNITKYILRIFAPWVVKYGTANSFQSCEMSILKVVPVGI